MRGGRGSFVVVMIGAVVLVSAGGARATGLDRWLLPLREVEVALARTDLPAARRAWQEAYQAALGSWRWEGMLEVGDARLRLGRAEGHREAAVARARSLYLAALCRARQQRSVEGALQTAEAFARLGDRRVAEQCVQLTEALAAETAGPGAPDRVREFAARLTDAASRAAARP